MPEFTIEMWPIERPIAYARNARVCPESAIAKVAASLKEFGFRQPIVVDAEGVIIAGHTRLLAAQRLGLAEVPIHVATGLTAAQVKAYRLADNRTAQETSWDDELLAIELEELLGLDIDAALTGFDEDELASLLAEPTQGLTDPDEVPDVPEVATTVAGDLWVCGSHRVLCGDATVATDVERLLAGVVPLLMVTDPPYGVNYDPTWRIRAGLDATTLKRRGDVANDDRADWREAWALFPGDVAYVWHSGLHSSEVATSLEESGFRMRSQIIWAKENLALSRSDYHWQHEPCWYAVRDGATGHWAGDRKQTTLWQIYGGGGHKNTAQRDAEAPTSTHGTQKPVECMRRPVENNSNAGQSVYDPFLGSGTTMIAAEQTGRVCYGLELDLAYCDVIVTRWQAFTGKAATLDGDGRTFAEIAEERGE